MKRPLANIVSRWRYLGNHPAFRRAPATTLARLVRWRIQCALGIPATVNLDPWQVRLFLPPQWCGGGATGPFTLRRLYEKELAFLQHLVSPGMVVVDAGANCGIYTVAAAYLVGPSGRVHSFEPGSKAFSVLKRNIEINQFQNVCAYRVALSNENGKACLYHSPQGQTSFTLGCPESTRLEFEEVTTRTLECVLEEQSTNRVGLLKLDVEGAEELVLRGAEQIIVRSRPTIILEMNALAAESMNLRRTGSWEFLKRHQYDFISLTDAGTPQDLNQPPSAEAITNVIAIPKEHRNESSYCWSRL